jgi:hypothetical protein
MKISAEGEGACFFINCHLESQGLTLTPLPSRTDLLSHPQTSKLTNSVWGGGGRSRVSGRGDRAPTPRAGRVTDSDGGGWVRVGGMRTGAGGRCYHVPTLHGAGEVKLVFWALRWKEKGEHSHNI